MSIFTAKDKPLYPIVKRNRHASYSGVFFILHNSVYYYVRALLGRSGGLCLLNHERLKRKQCSTLICELAQRRFDYCREKRVVYE